MLEKYKKPLTLNGITLDYTKETFVMGILNVTPDSFSDGGKYNNVEAAVAQAKKMVAEGAKIIDVGGESTRPGYERISDEDEIARIVPVIQALAKEVRAVISVDTYKANVARAAIEAGAHMINDIWGAKAEPEIAQVAADLHVPIILMHNRENMDYGVDFWATAKMDLEKSIAIAQQAGVPEHHIILDPGIGFAKNTGQNIVMMQHLKDLVAMGYPVLLATSRKSMIGNVLKLPVEERLEGTSATVVYGIEKGCHMIRVHDVKEMTRATYMADVLVGKRLFKEEA
ncbi:MULTISPECIES: dihydropteroate synthase [Lysinibacillus]|jgi:dihydropteroate synthase|uniref:Dihydropteroate synthase n=1 Tax=Lysinibacillus fusiformis TaxID=28031 RepID=A0A2I0UW52_9BACI|nr:MULTISPECIES: dihydropteroate synthase [Lysinibacillus]KUF32227.1 dihydropteroate synthase [Lysinibacillus sp. F5]MEE3809707.1 dihydropteroate synthase [Lysinibacillus fusiformis]PKU50265.1 dihydropteroate synthase [Lysinibacillus fusiformis]WCH47928.1 dihydropteroate synthase [Lysinibacillus sp. OF-1]WKT76706.1 dihydropteroate synthase [Lysinibacillus fusiformis]